MRGAWRAGARRGIHAPDSADAAPFQCPTPGTAAGQRGARRHDASPRGHAAGIPMRGVEFTLTWIDIPPWQCWCKARALGALRIRLRAVPNSVRDVAENRSPNDTARGQPPCCKLETPYFPVYCSFFREPSMPRIAERLVTNKSWPPVYFDTPSRLWYSAGSLLSLRSGSRK